jgi:hypothetical protein
MERHVFEGGINIVPVALPSTGMQVDLDVTARNELALNAQNRSAKIRSRFTVPKARVEHFDPAAIHRSKLLPRQSLMEPHRLKEFLGRRALILSQEGTCVAGPPFGIKAGAFHG